jgi:hypothetical protein
LTVSPSEKGNIDRARMVDGTNLARYRRAKWKERRDTENFVGRWVGVSLVLSFPDESSGGLCSRAFLGSAGSVEPPSLENSELPRLQATARDSKVSKFLSFYRELSHELGDLFA